MNCEYEIKDNSGVSDYNRVKTVFFRNLGIVPIKSDGQIEMLSFEEGASSQDKTPDSDFPFVEHPLNSEAAKIFAKPEFLKNYFENEGFETHTPRRIVNRDGSTLFISAGVQRLERIYMNEEPVPSRGIYVAQPVFRTQYVGQAGEGFSSSFVNVCIESVNKGVETHFQNLQKIFTLFDNLGLDRKGFQFISDQQESVWGEHKHVQKRVKIFFQGLEIGDAILIEGFPQKTRESLEISDIGLGYERIKWILKGGSYWGDTIDASQENHTHNTKDAIKTLTLLAGSGVVPHYKNHGYRFRLLSKKLVEELTTGESRVGINDLFSYYYKYWNGWTNLEVAENISLQRIQDENVRNFNNELISRLKIFYEGVDVDINRPTNQLVKLLRGTPADSNKVQGIINDMGGQLL